MTDRPTLAEEVRRGFERALEHMVRLEKRFDAVEAELAACRADLTASTARIIQTIAAPWRTNVYTITLERISTGETGRVDGDAAGERRRRAGLCGGRHPAVTGRKRSLGCFGGGSATGSNLVNRSGSGNDPARQAPNEGRGGRIGHGGVHRRAGVVAGIARRPTWG